jgi:hypothetical protein
MTYILQSELTIDKNGTVEKSLYEIVFLLELLEQEEDIKTFYNKELNMNFAESYGFVSVYEIELYRICLALSERLDKANDFTRRLMLRYDCIQPKVNTRGKVVSVQNTKELQDVWQPLKEGILEDYEGDAVTDYLKEVEAKMLTQDFILSPMSQYFFFGLLFPGIPVNHSNDWNNTRDIEISDYEEEKFQETVSFDRETDDLKLYRISGNTFPDSKFVLEDFSGLVRIKKGEILPVQSDVTINYKIYNQRYQWVFNLEQY